ncbi:hypothetical protein WG8_0619 [Paenibacillus sp. Aloe-11]|nr:hypothetical protein WG8_0619 [Paenibacillus sp. Aloe-11]
MTEYNDGYNGAETVYGLEILTNTHLEVYYVVENVADDTRVNIRSVGDR